MQFPLPKSFVFPQLAIRAPAAFPQVRLVFPRSVAFWGRGTVLGAWSAGMVLKGNMGLLGIRSEVEPPA